MYKRNLPKAQSGRKVQGFNNLYYKDDKPNYNLTFTPQPEKENIIDEGNVINKARTTVKSIGNKLKESRDKKRAPYQKQYDNIDDKKKSIKELRSELNKINKSNRLADRESNLSLREKRLKNRLENAKYLDEQRDEQRDTEHESKADTQYEKQDKLFDKTFQRRERSNARKNRLNEERNTKAKTSNVNSQINQALKSGRVRTDQELKKLENIKNIEQKANERQYQILQDHKKKNKKLEKRRLSPLSILPDGTSVNSEHFNYDPSDELYEMQGIIRNEYDEDEEIDNNIDQSQVIPSSSNINDGLIKFPFIRYRDGSTNVVNKVSNFNSVKQDGGYTNRDKEWFDAVNKKRRMESFGDSWYHLNNLKKFAENRLNNPSQAYPSHTFSGTKNDYWLDTQLDKSNVEMFDVMMKNRERLESEMKSFNNELKTKLQPKVTPEEYMNSIKQDGGYIDESDFDYTEDVDLDDLNEYLKGGYLPKAQGGMGSGEFTKNTMNDIYRRQNLLNDQIGMGMAMNFPNKYEYKIPEFEYKLEPSSKNLYDDSDVYNIKENTDILGLKSYQPYINLNVDKSFDTDINPDLFKEDNTTKSDYNPYRLYEPGNIVQHRSQIPGLAYNVAKFLQNPIKRKMFHDDPTLRRESISPDYTALNEGLNATSKAIRDNSRSVQGYLANMINANMQGAKEKNRLATDAEMKNIGFRQQYLDRVNANKAMIDQKKAQWQQQHIADKLTKEEFGKGAVDAAMKIGKNYGEMLNAEREDRIRLASMNQVSKDYDWERLPNGEFKVSYKGGPYKSMTKEEFTRTLDYAKKEEEDKVRKTLEEREKKIEEQQKLIAEQTKLMQEQLDWAKKQNLPPTTSKQFGGWINEKQRPMKRRNRLYY